MVMVRFGPEPPRTMLPFGTSVMLLLEAVTTSALAGVSTSPIEKLIAGVATFFKVFCVPIAEIVGNWLMKLTVTWNDWLYVKLPAVNVMVICEIPSFGVLALSTGVNWI